MIHQALYNLYPNITSILDGEEGLQAFEGDVNITNTIDMAVVENLAASLEQDAKKEQLRAERNKKLAETDWWALSDVTMNQAQKDYRTALRNIPEAYDSLDDVVWPVNPHTNV